jgi:hypothetical protein
MIVIHNTLPDQKNYDDLDISVKNITAIGKEIFQNQKLNNSHDMTITSSRPLNLFYDDETGNSTNSAIGIGTGSEIGQNFKENKLFTKSNNRKIKFKSTLYK